MSDEVALAVRPVELEIMHSGTTGMGMGRIVSGGGSGSGGGELGM